MFFQNDSIFKDFKQGYGNVVITGFQWFQYGQQNKNLYPTSYDNFADHNRWSDTLIARIECALPARMMSPYSNYVDKNKPEIKQSLEGGKITIFPNPFSNEASFTLAQNSSGTPSKFYITDITGRDASSLFRINSTKQKDDFIVNSSSNTNGIYYLYAIFNGYKTQFGVISVVK